MAIENKAQTTADLDNAEKIQKTKPNDAAAIYKSVLSLNQSDDETVRLKERALLNLGEVYKELQKPGDLADLIRAQRPFLTSIPKAKTAKIVKALIDDFAEIPKALDLQIVVCREFISWAVEQKRVFLKQNLEARLAALYLDNKMYTESLVLISTLLKELKRLDDKMVLVEVQLLEARVCHAVKNFPKSKAALTAARTSANGIYCPPALQASLDMMSGILHAEDKDYKTAFSYFFETLEGYQTISSSASSTAADDGTVDKKAILALKYMLLCKIMSNLPDDVNSIIHGKLALKYAGRQLDAMKAVATAHKDRSLEDFEAALGKYSDELQNDIIIRTHLSALYDTLLEQNLVRIIEPYSRVEIAHIASVVKRPTPEVETKLSQMILDKVFHGILDQGAGCLVVFDEPPADKTYSAALDTMKNMEKVVESLYEKAAKLN